MRIKKIHFAIRIAQEEKELCFFVFAGQSYQRYAVRASSVHVTQQHAMLNISTNGKGISTGPILSTTRRASIICPWDATTQHVKINQQMNCVLCYQRCDD